MIAVKAGALVATGLWVELKSGIVGVGGFLIAGAAIWGFVVKPMRRFGKQAADVHTVLMGTDGDATTGEEARPSLAVRLKEGDTSFLRIEAKVDELHEQITRGLTPKVEIVEGKLGEVEKKLARVEGVFDVIGSNERLEIRSAIAAAAQDDQPPPAPIPIRRDP